MASVSLRVTQGQVVRERVRQIWVLVRDGVVVVLCVRVAARCRSKGAEPGYPSSVNLFEPMEEMPRTFSLFRLKKKAHIDCGRHHIYYPNTWICRGKCHPLSLPGSAADLLIISARIAKMAGLSSLFSLYRTESFT